ncbi:MAG: hypothetical protein ACRC35_04825 [Angustibacter sp.]
MSRRQAQRLAQLGRLHAVRRVGGVVLVDSTSVLAARRTGRGPGRRWSPTTVWAAVELLENGRTDRLSGSMLSRLRGRLQRTDVDEFVRLASHRATTVRCVQTRRGREALSQAMQLSGVSRLADPGVAARFALTADRGTQVEGYVLREAWPAVRERFGLLDDAEGDVVVRVSAQRVPDVLATVALDLVERGSARESAAGGAYLGGLLQ